MNTEQSREFVAGVGSLALINAGLAQSKRRSGLSWFFLSCFPGPIATFLLVSVFREPLPPPALPPVDSAGT